MLQIGPMVSAISLRGIQRKRERGREASHALHSGLLRVDILLLFCRMALRGLAKAGLKVHVMRVRSKAFNNNTRKGR